jgi:hypothetical protein
MLKFFRRIRQDQLNEGNLKRYLSYSIGEILLVMIGILLAFQVDNWNDQRNNKKAEILYYQNIKRQLIEDMDLISGNIDYNNLYLGQYEFAAKIIEANDRSKMDTLVDIALNLTKYSDFHRVSNIYETIVNSGQIELLNNHEVILGLQRLEETYIYINKMEGIHFDMIKLIVIPDLVNSINWSLRKIERPDKIYTFEFKNRFTVAIDIANEKDEIYDRALDEINEIIELIDKELNSN